MAKGSDLKAIGFLSRMFRKPGGVEEAEGDNWMDWALERAKSIQGIQNPSLSTAWHRPVDSFRRSHASTSTPFVMNQASAPARSTGFPRGAINRGR